MRSPRIHKQVKKNPSKTKSPFVYNNLKFDLRIYVLITGCNPLRLFLHKNGLVRFATQAYEKANHINKLSNYMHLTNFAINKENPKFVSSLEVGKTKREDRTAHKRSIIDFFQELSEAGHQTDKVWDEIKDIVVKTVCSIQPILKHNYLSCNPDDPYNQTCFELLGFDILINEKMKPFLLEVNHAPSFRVGSKVDMRVKKKLIRDTFQILNINNSEKKKLKELKKKNYKARTLTGRRVKLSDGPMKEKCVMQRDGYCDLNSGEFERIFPPKDKKKMMFYTAMMEQAENIYHRFTGAGDVAKVKGIEKILKSSTQSIENFKSSFKRAKKIYTKNHKKYKTGKNDQKKGSNIFEKRKKKLRKILGGSKVEQRDKRKGGFMKRQNSFMYYSKTPNGSSKKDILRSSEKLTVTKITVTQGGSSEDIIELEKMIDKREKGINEEIKKVTDKIENFEKRMKMRIRSSRPPLSRENTLAHRPLTTSHNGPVLAVLKEKAEYRIKMKKKGGKSTRSRSNQRSEGKKKGKKIDPYLAWDPFKSFDRTYKDRMKSLGIRFVGAGQLKNR